MITATRTIFGLWLVTPTVLFAQVDTSVVRRNDSVSVRFIDVDLRAAVQSLSRYLPGPVVFGSISAGRVTLETPRPVPVNGVLPLLRGLLRTHQLELVEEDSVFRIRGTAPVPATSGGPDASQRALASQLQLFVVPLKHAKAADVAATLSALFGKASALGELGAAPPTLSEQLRQSQLPISTVGQPVQSTQTSSGGASLVGEVTIVPDHRANSLLIRSSRADFALLDSAIAQVDVRPLQVLIEVLIAEVRRDRNFDLGVDLDLPSQSLGPGNGRGEATVAGGGLGDFVLKLMSLGALDLDATLRAAESRGDVAIVSRPVVVTANNKRAEINVGSERPFVQVSRTLPTDSPLRDQVVQYRDVGTRLFVMPTISNDGYIMLEVVQEVNAATTETAFDAPIISTRSVQTSLLLRDSQTVALGGLSDRQRDVNRRGIPLLSRIPLAGGLFGRFGRRATETELLLFITPRIIRSDDDADRLTAPMLRRAEKVKP